MSGRGWPGPGAVSYFDVLRCEWRDASGGAERAGRERRLAAESVLARVPLLVDFSRCRDAPSVLDTGSGTWATLGGKARTNRLPAASLAVARRPGGVGATWMLAPLVSPAEQALAEALACMRAAGVEPHPWGEEGDADFAAVLARAAEVRRGDATGRPLDSRGMPAFTVGEGVVSELALPREEAVRPLSTLGLNRGRWVFPGLASDTEQRNYGWFWNVLIDAARAGCGFVRHVESGDLLWAELFPVGDDDDAEAGQAGAIPDPLALQAKLLEPFALARFTALVLVAQQLGVQVIPTLFTLGGGTRHTRAGLGVRDPATGLVDDDEDEGVYALAQDKAASHEGRPLLPTPCGWSDFYWDSDKVGEKWPDAETEAYHKLALSLVQWDDGPYSEECVRRKALAVAAYGDATGQFLARLDDALSACVGGRLRDVVPYLEAGNEMDTCWLVGSGGEAGDNAEEATALSRGAKQYARFHLLVAAPLRLHWPDARFRAGGLASDVAPGKWAAQRRWLAGAVTEHAFDLEGFYEGVQDNLDCLRETGFDWVSCTTLKSEYDDNLSFTDVHTDWLYLLTCHAAGYYWPPAEARVDIDWRRCVHQVGLHWYHYWDDCGGDFLPVGTLLDRMQRFRDDVVTPAGAAGLSLSRQVGEVGTPSEALPPALAPDCGSEDPEGLHSNSLVSQRWQAGMVARDLLAFVAAGCERASWHTFMSGIANSLATEKTQGWTGFSTMGLRQDTYPGDPAEFVAETMAFRRASWFTYRRVAWLLSHARSVEVVDRPEVSCATVRVVARRGFLVGTRSWPNAWIAWVDQDAPFREYWGRVGGGREAVMVPLVPLVTVDPSSPEPLDGFPSGEHVDWEWPGWEQGATLGPDVGIRDSVVFTVRRVDGRATFGPTLFFTDGGEFIPGGTA